jgi:hypothetical protein
MCIPRTPEVDMSIQRLVNLAIVLTFLSDCLSVRSASWKGTDFPVKVSILAIDSDKE